MSTNSVDEWLDALEAEVGDQDESDEEILDEDDRRLRAYYAPRVGLDRDPTPSWDDLLEAARRAGRIEGLNEAATLCEERGKPSRDPRMTGIEEGSRYCAEDLRALAKA